MNAFRSAVIIVVLIAVGIGWWWFHRSETTAPAHETSPSVALATVREGTIDVTVSAVGRVGASSGSDAKLAFVLPGRIASIPVHVGQRISTGDVLASLDTTSLSLVSQQANADASAAQAQASAAAVDRTATRIALDLRTLERTERLYAAGVSARKDVDDARAQLAADRADRQTFIAGLAAARAQSTSARMRAAIASRDVENAAIRAPFAGVVTAVSRNVGESVDPTTAVIALAPAETTRLALQVNAQDASRVASGDIVHVRSATAATPIDGRVVGVASAVDPTTQSATVLVSADVSHLLAGSAIDADIVVAHDRGVVVPKSAIVADPNSGATLAFIYAKNKDGDPVFTQRDIHVVFENDTTAEVTGLHTGERIAATGAFELLAPSGGD